MEDTRRRFPSFLSLLLTAGVLLVGGIVAWLMLGRFVLPLQKVTNLEVVNLTDSAGTLMWVTDGAVADSVTLSSGNKKTKEVKSSKVHFVELSGLKPGKDYDYQVSDQFGRLVVTGKFTTRPILVKLNLPRTVYGKVVDRNNKGVAGTLVAVRRIFLGTSPQVQSDRIAGLTNDSGNFVLDINNVFLNTIPAGAEERLEIKVWSPDGKYKENLLTTVQTQPIPNIAIE